ncbi:OmpP1/FadL family transporter [Halomonas chromatireducens]|uniref:Putative outer membrane protein n=1 Tax=Halomonas chromatireducens TaxID=507626 RepID=A0A109UMU6_9GAMM|nr:outer membrane protein transport protein [Halomonas chromatireducens]AMD02073.1 Putative outer membrane protein precursor [Halomonas chromatireducens]
MHNKFNKLTWAVAVAAAAFASQANAGGYQINEQSVSGQGYGHAGRSSNVNDATIVFGNPAGMSFLDRAQLTAGGTYLNVNSRIRNAEATRTLGAGPAVDVEGTSEGDMVPGTLIPFAFYAHPVNEQLAFGFGVYAPFGSKTEYEDGFVGRNLGNYTELRVMSAQPTVSYRFNDQWSVGAGITYNRVDGELHRRVPAPGTAPGATEELDARIEGDDDGWGYNLGVIYQPVPETTLGLTYRSKVSYTLTGDFRATATGDIFDGVGVVPEGTVIPRDAQLDLTTPETINFSVTQQMSDRLKLMAGASWTRWSRFDEIRVIDPNDPGGDPITFEQQDYSNAWAYALGGEYQLNPQLALRAGITLDFTPTSDEFRSARIPSDDRRIFSVGAGWTPVDNLTVDLAYSYLTERSTHVDQERQDAGGAITSTYTADYKNEAHGFGAQLTYRF